MFNDVSDYECFDLRVIEMQVVRGDVLRVVEHLVLVEDNVHSCTYVVQAGFVGLVLLVVAHLDRSSEHLLQRRHRWRALQGAVMFDRPEGRFRRRDQTLELDVIDPSPSRHLVSEAMLLMGSVVAEFGMII